MYIRFCLLSILFLSGIFTSLAEEKKLPRHTLKAYAKKSAVAIDGVLLEQVWENIEPIYLTPAGAAPGKSPEPAKGTILFRAVYEADYTALGLALYSAENFALPEKKREHTKDICTVTLSPVDAPGEISRITFSPMGILSGKSSGPYPAGGAVWPVKNWIYAELRFPIPAKDFFYGQGQRYLLKITRKMRDAKGRQLLYSWEKTLLCSSKVIEVKKKRLARRTWRNGNFNTFFKRPNRRWAPNWDLGEKEFLQQGWNLNKAKKGIPQFEVKFHPRKNEKEELDCYVLLKNGDFYQIYKGRERHLAYSFKVKGKGKFNVYFYRFAPGNYSQFLGKIPVMSLQLNSAKWKTYTGKITKPTPKERLALAFEAEDARIYLEDAEVWGITEK